MENKEFVFKQEVRGETYYVKVSPLASSDKFKSYGVFNTRSQLKFRIFVRNGDNIKDVFDDWVEAFPFPVTHVFNGNYITLLHITEKENIFYAEGSIPGYSAYFRNGTEGLVDIRKYGSKKFLDILKNDRTLALLMLDSM